MKIYVLFYSVNCSYLSFFRARVLMWSSHIKPS